MTADIVNLNKHRKAKARADRTERANENAVKFGRTKTQKSSDKKQREKLSRDLDGKKRDP